MLTEAQLTKLIEEHIWCANEDTDAFHQAIGHDEHAWLTKEVLPTLVPALHRLVELAEAHMNAKGSMHVETPAQGEGKKEDPDFGPTGRAPPIVWLAEYLLRNSHRHAPFLEQHPYVMVSSGKAQGQ